MKPVALIMPTVTATLPCVECEFRDRKMIDRTNSWHGLRRPSRAFWAGVTLALMAPSSIFGRRSYDHDFAKEFDSVSASWATVNMAMCNALDQIETEVVHREQRQRQEQISIRADGKHRHNVSKSTRRFIRRRKVGHS
jgi:hypothetical protein